jgi:hypothetical protein
MSVRVTTDQTGVNGSTNAAGCYRAVVYPAPAGTTYQVEINGGETYVAKGGSQSKGGNKTPTASVTAVRPGEIRDVPTFTMEKAGSIQVNISGMNAAVTSVKVWPSDATAGDAFTEEIDGDTSVTLAGVFPGDYLVQVLNSLPEPVTVNPGSTSTVNVTVP